MLGRDLFLNIKKVINENDDEVSAIKILFSFVLKKDFALCLDTEINEIDAGIIKNYCSEYIKGKPVQYITKESYFLDDVFYVDERVLIPRFATEEVLLKAFENIDDHINTIVDIGCGSGVIALTAKKTFPNKRVIATDISDKALEVAQINKERLDLDIELLQGNLLTPLIENDIKVDMIISNPPYINENYPLDKRVKYEPSLALFAGDGGLAFYRDILENCSKVLNPKGIIVFEIGYDQKERIANLISEVLGNKVKCSFFEDLDGNDRMVVIKFA